MPLFLILHAIFFADVSCHLVTDVDKDFYTINAPGDNFQPIRVVDEAPGDHRHTRWKRQDNISPLSAAQKQAIVDKHNEFRSATTPSAANMQYMTYDETYADWAAAWAAECKWYHGMVSGIPDDQSGQGQNLWLGGGKPNGATQVTSWHDNEKSNYNFETKTCSGVCGHYTQVVWHHSAVVGCARAFCSTAYRKDGTVQATNVWIFNCHYQPGGNFRGQRPYQGGPPCTRCPDATNTHCYENQCNSRDCDGEGISGCDCNMICEHCGKRMDETCSCNCLNFNYINYRCQTECADNHNNCYNGWWPQHCGSHPSIPKNCPLMCGECEEDDPLGDCSASTRQIRLVNGSASWEGRLEVQLMTDTWGTVCKRNFGTVDAEVVCRQLGFPGVLGINKDGGYGVGTIPITMFEVGCAGTEDFLAGCTHNTQQLQSFTCVHKTTDVVGVRCAYAQWGEWGAWSNCTTADQSEMRTRQKVCDDNNESDAIDCEGAAPSETDSCDTVPPTLTVPSDITVYVGSGQAPIAVTWSAVTASDNSGEVTLTSTHNSGDNFTLGATNITYTATDSSGNIAEDSFTVTVIEDNTPPTITLPADITVNTDTGMATAVVTWAVTTSDNSGGVVTLIQSHNSSDRFPIGDTVVTYTATDPYGNSASDSFNITVIDNTPPTITLPVNITVDTDTGMATAVVNWTVTTSDNSGGVVTLIQSHNSGDSFPIGDTVVMYTATDPYGNSAKDSFNITVKDNTPPTITLPVDITVDTDTGMATAVVAWTVTTSDNSGGVVTLIQSHNSSDRFPIGDTVVTYTATDPYDNSAIDSFNITVKDTEKPVLMLPSNITQSTATGVATATVTWTTVTATDNSGVTPTITTSYYPGSTFTIGMNTVTYTATDPSNNTVVGSFIVTIQDMEVPVLMLPSDITQSTDTGMTTTTVTWPTVTATDNSGVTPTITTSHNPGSTFTIGVTTVTYTATDPYGNTVQGSFVVTIYETPDSMANKQHVKTVQVLPAVLVFLLISCAVVVVIILSRRKRRSIDLSGKPKHENGLPTEKPKKDLGNDYVNAETDIQLLQCSVESDKSCNHQP